MYRGVFRGVRRVLEHPPQACVGFTNTQRSAQRQYACSRSQRMRPRVTLRRACARPIKNYTEPDSERLSLITALTPAKVDVALQTIHAFSTPLL